MSSTLWKAASRILLGCALVTACARPTRSLRARPDDGDRANPRALSRVLDVERRGRSSSARGAAASPSPRRSSVPAQPALAPVAPSTDKRVTATAQVSAPAAKLTRRQRLAEERRIRREHTARYWALRRMHKRGGDALAKAERWRSFARGLPPSLQRLRRVAVREERRWTRRARFEARRAARLRQRAEARRSLVDFKRVKRDARRAAPAVRVAMWSALLRRHAAGRYRWKRYARRHVARARTAVRRALYAQKRAAKRARRRVAPPKHGRTPVASSTLPRALDAIAHVIEVPPGCTCWLGTQQTTFVGFARLADGLPVPPASTAAGWVSRFRALGARCAAYRHVAEQGWIYARMCGPSRFGPACPVGARAASTWAQFATRAFDGCAAELRHAERVLRRIGVAPPGIAGEQHAVKSEMTAIANRALTNQTLGMMNTHTIQMNHDQARQDARENARRSLNRCLARGIRGSACYRFQPPPYAR